MLEEVKWRRDSLRKLYNEWGTATARNLNSGENLLYARWGR